MSPHFFRPLSLAVWALALCGSVQAQSPAAGGPVPSAYTLVFAAGEACTVPVEFKASSRLKVIPKKSGRLIWVFGQAITTLTNLNDPTRSITLRGAGHWNDTPAVNGAILSHFTGNATFIVGDEYGITHYTGSYTVVVAPDGMVYEPPVGNGKSINLCSLLE